MKTFKIIGFALVAVLLCFSACTIGKDDPIEPSPTPEVVKSEIIIDQNLIANGLIFSCEKGEQAISFSTNENWTLSVAATTSGATWCTASSLSGSKGDSSVKFSVTENTDYDNRSVSVTIKSGTATKTFTVFQKGVDALLVTTDTYEVSQEGGTIDIEVKANIDYTMEIAETVKSWITESSSRGLTSYKHTLNIAMNEENEKREGEIIFKSGDKIETVKVYQAGGAVILLSENEYIVSDKGDTIIVDIKSYVEFGVQMPEVDWILDEASSRGLSSHKLEYIILPNESYENRSTEIIYYDKNSELKDTLTVIQLQKDAIVLSEKELVVGSEGETVEVNLSTNVDFEISMPDVDWIEKVDSRSLVEHKLYFKIKENSSSEAREAEITFINKDSQLSETLIIKQKRKNIGLYLPDGSTFNSTVRDFLNKNSNIKKIKFVANSETTSESLLTTDQNGTKGYLVANGEWLEIHTSDKEFIANSNCFRMFRGTENYKFAFNSLTEIDFNNCFNTSSVENMSNMFAFCESLTLLDVSCFDTSNVTDMSQMFRYCQNLTTLDVTHFDTFNVTDMSQMFEYCQNLTDLDVSGFDTSKVTDMTFMFFTCTNLTSLNLNNFSFSASPIVSDMLKSVGYKSESKPIHITISEHGYSYLTQTDCGIDTSAKFVKSRWNGLVRTYKIS